MQPVIRVTKWASVEWCFFANENGGGGILCLKVGIQITKVSGQ